MVTKVWLALLNSKATVVVVVDVVVVVNVVVIVNIIVGALLVVTDNIMLYLALVNKC